MAPTRLAPCFCMSRALRLRLDFEKSPIKLNHSRVKTCTHTISLICITFIPHSHSLTYPALQNSCSASVLRSVKTCTQSCRLSNFKNYLFLLPCVCRPQPLHIVPGAMTTSSSLTHVTTVQGDPQSIYIVYITQWSRFHNGGYT